MSLIEQAAARDRIPEMLCAIRPDRYDPADKAWQDPVIDRVREEITEDEARTIAAARLVSTAEGSATKRTNRLLREILLSKQWPIDWLDALDWPLAVSDEERVALRAADADDFRHFAERERRAAALDFTVRNDTCEGALLVADTIDEQGVSRAAELSLPWEAA